LWVKTAHAQRLYAARLNLADQWYHIRGEVICFLFLGRNGVASESFGLPSRLPRALAVLGTFRP
jgi:hypothetical protein